MRTVQLVVPRYWARLRNCGQRARSGRMFALSIGLAAASFARSSIEAQSPVATTQLYLKTPNAVATQDMRRVSSVRELEDGRTLAIDIADDLIILQDWKLSASRQVARKGRGPGEYLEVGRVFPLGRDSSLLEDPNARRWILMEGTRLLRPINDSVRYATDIAFGGGDQRGRYLETHPFAYGRSTYATTAKIRVYAESLVVLLESAGGARVDTIARIGGSFSGEADITKVVKGASMSYVFFALFAAEEQALMFRDGWIAVARRDPYRVDWFEPSLRRRSGKPLPFTKVPVDARQKRAAMDRHWTGALHGVFTPAEMPGWPKFLPPFQPEALIAMPDGNVLVERTPDATISELVYDIVDRTGSLNGRIHVGPRERIVGFGRGTVYTVLIDDDELEHLRRHPWP